MDSDITISDNGLTAIGDTIPGMEFLASNSLAWWDDNGGFYRMNKTDAHTLADEARSAGLRVDWEGGQ